MEKKIIGLSSKKNYLILIKKIINHKKNTWNIIGIFNK